MEQKTFNRYMNLGLKTASLFVFIGVDLILGKWFPSYRVGITSYVWWVAFALGVLVWGVLSRYINTLFPKK